jgi:ribosomal protein S18 acetylase RimI-like enzyme
MGFSFFNEKVYTEIFYIRLTMFKFSHSAIFIASYADVAEITALLNSAYRGESSRQGWTTEAHLIGGNVRTNESSLQSVIFLKNSIVLKYLDEQNNIIGCVNLQQEGSKIYLGMLSVSPLLQGAGVGKQILKASEEYAQYLKCSSIYMTVISVRSELIEWYQRHGYQDTGERKPFVEDEITGNHLQPLEFMVLEKILNY